MTDTVRVETDDRGVATVTINRPEKHNAFGMELIAELIETFTRLNNDGNVRVMVLTGGGKSFSAGADLNWMRSMAEFTEEENFADSVQLAELMSVLDGMRCPTIARVNGPVFGGGVGLVTCCDIAVSVDTAKFALTEVRLGLVPAVISPYVIDAIGERQARRYFLTGEAIEADKALAIGLVHEVVGGNKLDETVEATVRRLLKGGPKALIAAKELIAEHVGAGETARDRLKRKTSRIIAQLRVSAEGQEGLSSFLEKRKPKWVEDDK